MLSALIWMPVLGAIAILLLPQARAEQWARPLALGVAGFVLLLTLILSFEFDPAGVAPQFAQRLPWIEPLGLNYTLGMDGLSFPLIWLNSVLTLVAIFATRGDIERPRFYYPLILFLSTGAAGAFLAQNLLLFFLFYEIEIVPLYFLIAIWGGSRRGYAAMKFLIYTALSGILVLASFLGLVWASGAKTFDYQPLLQQNLPLDLQLILLITLLVGVFIKIPIFPFHTWLPDAHVEASTPVSVLLAGVLLKLGTYALIKFGVGLFFQAWVVLAPSLAILATISALYGAFSAIAQQDMKKVVAYSSIAHMAYILLAAAASTPLSMTAAIFQMVSHGLISALLFLLVGVVYKKTGTRDVHVLQGLLNPERGLPITGSLMIVGVMASAGLPGMVGFIAEFMVFRSTFPIFTIATLLCLVGTGLTAVYFLLMINRVFFGRLPDALATIPKVAFQDHLPSFVLTMLLILFGLQPSWVVRWSETQATNFILSPALRPPSLSLLSTSHSPLPTPDFPPPL
ncbi:MAG: NADH-quinone oxidoreductase subunit M [Spirulina sp. DLM2.Bin59]|nr:MAG: NADH-quinone oxidoreductase subunit M [Spirulina sp. DLM2.Bin59]